MTIKPLRAQGTDVMIIVIGVIVVVVSIGASIELLSWLRLLLVWSLFLGMMMIQ